MIGSHNSLTYFPPKNIIGKLLLPWTRCQDTTLTEQYAKGVEYFDIRVRFKKGKAQIVHNHIVFDGNINEELAKLNDTVTKPVYLRVILDIRKKPKDYTEQTADFLSFLSFIDYKFPKLKIDSAITYWDWHELRNPKIAITECHASVLSPWYDFIFGINYCRWILIFTRDEYYKYSIFKKESNKVLLVDYVEQ